jgi:hypothetical protein
VAHSVKGSRSVRKGTRSSLPAPYDDQACRCRSHRQMDRRTGQARWIGGLSSRARGLGGTGADVGKDAARLGLRIGLPGGWTPIDQLPADDPGSDDQGAGYPNGSSARPAAGQPDVPARPRGDWQDVVPRDPQGGIEGRGIGQRGHPPGRAAWTQERATSSSQGTGTSARRREGGSRTPPTCGAPGMPGRGPAGQAPGEAQVQQGPEAVDIGPHPVQFGIKGPPDGRINGQATDPDLTGRP